MLRSVFMFLYEAINIHITFYLYTYFTTISFAFAEKENVKIKEFTLFPHERTLIIGRNKKNEEKNLSGSLFCWLYKSSNKKGEK